MKQINVEKWVYESSIADVRETKNVSLAYELCTAWSKNAEKQNLASSAIRVLLGRVIPELTGGTPKELPDWVDDNFEEIPARPQNVEDWVKAFPNGVSVALNDRLRGGQTYFLKEGYLDPDYAKNKGYGQFRTANGLSGSRHKDEEVNDLRFFFMDFDGGDKDSLLERIAVLPVAPSILVETKSGFHVYFRLKKHKRTQADWRAVEKEMIAKEGADPSASNPARVLRMPFTWHCKEEPFLIELRDWNENKYAFEDFEKCYPPKLKKIYTGEKIEFYGYKRQPYGMLVEGIGEGRHGGLENYLKAAYFLIKDYPEHASGLRLYTKNWYEHGHTPQKPNWEREVDELCDWFEKRQWG